MTYNWNKMVDITVPVGTNGWMYSGEVIINGVKVKFPVGTPTTVPEPAAALLNKMIELEKEDDLNTAKPNNHYIGNVTVPEGKTLTLAKGAKVVDESGALGAPSAPSPVVILPETVLAADENSGGVMVIMTPWEVDPVAGNVYAVAWNDTVYECEAYAATTDTLPSGSVVMGDPRVIQGWADNVPGNPDAPFGLACIRNEDGATIGAYGVVDFYEEALPFATVSIVLKEDKASSGGNAGGGFIVNVTAIEWNADQSGATCTVDKPFSETLAAIEAGKWVTLKADLGFMTVFPTVMYNAEMIVFNLQNGPATMQMIYMADGSVTYSMIQ